MSGQEKEHTPQEQLEQARTEGELLATYLALRNKTNPSVLPLIQRDVAKRLLDLGNVERAFEFTLTADRQDQLNQAENQLSGYQELPNHIQRALQFFTEGALKQIGGQIGNLEEIVGNFKISSLGLRSSLEDFSRDANIVNRVIGTP